MIRFKDFCGLLNEDLITFGGGRPNFGNIVILAGGAGSGKGFVISNLIGISGKILDVDASKMAALKSDLVIAKVKAETGEDISKYNLRNPEDVRALHFLLKDMINKWREPFFTAVAAADPGKLPNIIFDVTLEKWSKFNELIETAQLMGYEKKNIHLVWVVNDLDVAKEQNKHRDRVVPEDILIATHLGAAKTMRDVMNIGDGIANILDGDIWVTFNNKHAGDSKMKTSEHGGRYLERVVKFHLKKAGKKTITPFPQEMLDKLTAYTRTDFNG